MAYQGKVYTSSAEEEVLLEEKNHMGGDSIVRLKVYSHSLSNVDEGELSIREGTARTWQGIDLSLLPVGDTTLVAAYSSIYGCDSTYTLKLTVVAKVIEGLDDIKEDDRAEKFFHNGHLYIRKRGRVYNLQGVKVE